MIKFLDSEIGAIRNYWDLMSGQVIDLGGGQTTCEKATRVVDLVTQPSQGQWIQGDLCDPDTYKQFSDKQFDWVYSNHVVEDVYDPFIIFREAQRIAKRGLFGMPHWSRELTIQSDRAEWESISGWPNHHWIIGVNKENGVIEFFPKMCWLPLGEGWNTTTNNINFEWDGGDLPVKWLYHEYRGNMLRKELVAWLSERWLP